MESSFLNLETANGDSFGGVHDVDTRWNGMTTVHEVSMGDNYSFTVHDMHSRDVELQGGLPGPNGGQGVPGSGGECSYPDLPPLKLNGTGITAPLVSNPFDVSSGDASYTYYADDHDDAYFAPDQSPYDSSRWEPIAQPHDAFNADGQLDKPWQLNDSDVMMLFDDYTSDDYVADLHTADELARFTAAQQQNEGYHGVMNPVIPLQEPLEGEVISYHSVVQLVIDDEDRASADLYRQTRESEQHYEVEVEDVDSLLKMYQFDELTKTTYNEVEASPPDLVMTTDDKGRATPMASCVMVARSVQGKTCSRLLRVLFDSGGSKSMWHRRAIPRHATITPQSSKMQMRTLAGNYSPLGTIEAKDLRLPAFDKNRVINDHEFHVFDSDCQYDVILGGDFLRKIGMNLKYDTLEVEWFGNTMPMETVTHPGVVRDHVESYLSQIEMDTLGVELDSYLAAPILDARYDKVDIDTVVSVHCAHLDAVKQQELKQVLIKHTKLFDGTLGKYPGEPMHIELEPNAKPVYRRPYPIPQVHLATFKKELDHLVAIGVLSPVRDTEWGLPTFITPKKDGRVRWVSDLRELNKVVKRTQYTLPIISDILRKRRGYEFLTKLDISMQYYTFELDDESKRICTIVTPFGPYCYNRVPMGLKISPGYAQARMEEVLRGIDEQDVYIDDIGIFTDTWERHLDVIDDVLTRLEQNGFTVNPLKCEWGVKETDWLGYWLTPTGLKPWAKKVDAILKLKAPTTATELRTFLGMVTYYRDMWPRRSHILEPLTKLSGLKKGAKVEWTPELDKAFHQMKAVIANEALMAYPNHNLPFHIYTDASDYQVGACIMQQGRPVAYFSRKLSGPQRNYTTMEKELLAIVMVLLEFRSMLLGADLSIFTDHKNLTFSNFNTQRVLRWRTFIEEYSPCLFYLEGKLNVLADAFSRLPRFDDPSVMEGKSPGASMDSVPLDMSYSNLDEPELYDCIRHLPELDDYFNMFVNLPATEDNPLSYAWLKDMQDDEADLETLIKDATSGYHLREFGDMQLVCYSESDTKTDEDWKIVLSEEAVKPSIKYFHQLFNHPGKNRLMQGMARYYHPRLRELIEDYTKNCEVCQRYKVDNHNYGKLAARDVRAAPWEQVDVDLIGPWKIKTGTGKTYEFLALTSIDRVTGLPELIRIDNKTSQHVADKFNESWLSRYPRPFACCHDNGGEFTGWEFQQLLSNFGIKDVPTTSRNPAANGICERMHKSIGNDLTTFIHENPPRTLADAKVLVDRSLATASHSVRVNISQATGYSPGALAFHRDMLLDVPLLVNLLDVRDRRQVSVDSNLLRVNNKRTSYDYQPGQQVLKKRHEINKLGERWDGPYDILRVHTNGNVTIELMEGVSERINIRRVKPFHKPQ